MSMICKYRALTAEEAARARRDEDYLMSLTAYDSSIPLADLFQQIPWWFRLLMRITGAPMPKPGAAPVASGGGTPVLDIHKSWHGLHWLLCQDAWDGPEPLRHAVLGGEEIGDDLGYGPAHLVDAETVRAVAAALADTSRGTLRRRFDPQAMAAAEIYGFDEEDNEWRRDFLAAFDHVKRFFADAAGRGHSVLIWLT
jgi:hypothetical protein